MDIRSLLEKYKNAVFQKDVGAFTSLFDEQVLIFDMWQQWSYHGLDAWREVVNGWFTPLGRNSDVITYDSLHIHEDTEMAVATAIVRFTAVSEKGEELRFLENRFTWVFRKNGEDWKITHQHSSGPIDFNTMKVILQR